MSKLRSINTKIWCDTWFEDLTVSQKLLFIYFITNEKTNMLGIYEISIRKISFETGINIKEIEKSFKVFEQNSKIKYVQNRVILSNYLKHQNYNFNMKKSAIDVYNLLPYELKINEINKLERTNEAFETLCNGFGMVRKVEVEVEVEVEVKYEIEKRKADFKKSLQPFLEKYGADMLNEFYEYWIEKKPKGRKMRFEMEKTWDVSLRLARWSRNDYNKTSKKEIFDNR